MTDTLRTRVRRRADERGSALAGHVVLSGSMVVALLTMSLALVLIWTFLTEPVELARTVTQGGTTDAVRLLASAVYDLVTRLLSWL